MPDLTATTAFGGQDPAHDTFGTITLAERPDIALATLAARRDAHVPCAQALGMWLGEAAPGIALHSEQGSRSAFWVGPATWMVETTEPRQDGFARELAARMAGIGSVTDQSGAWVRFDLSGTGLDAMLARLTNLDLVGLPASFARSTVMEQVGCYLLRRGAGYTVYGPHSYAESLYHALSRAACSI